MDGVGGSSLDAGAESPPIARPMSTSDLDSSMCVVACPRPIEASGCSDISVDLRLRVRDLTLVIFQEWFEPQGGLTIVEIAKCREIV